MGRDKTDQFTHHLIIKLGGTGFRIRCCSLDKVPVSQQSHHIVVPADGRGDDLSGARVMDVRAEGVLNGRSEEHTSELQSRGQLVCRLLLEKNNTLVII